MSPDQQLTKQTGAGLPIALFIITVLSLIVLGMSQLQESSGNAISLQIQSQRAFFAAESGAQAVIADLLKEADEGSISRQDNRYDIEFSGANGLAGCEATVEYSSSANDVALVESFGVCGKGAPDEARRTVEVRLR